MIIVPMSLPKTGVVESHQIMSAMETPKTGSSSTALHALRGVLGLGADGKALATNGIALQPAVARCILAAWHEARPRQRKVFPAETPDGAPIALVALPPPNSTMHSPLTTL